MGKDLVTLNQPVIESNLSTDLFVLQRFTSHSGLELSWKIDCDALTDGDITALAHVIAERQRFSKVWGIPRGGLRLAEALGRYCDVSMPEGVGWPTLIVDDVLTTGDSMEALRAELLHRKEVVVGVVLFCRSSHCPDWVKPVFQLML